MFETQREFLCFAGLGVRGTPYIFTRIEFSTSMRPPISRRRPDSAAKRQNKTLAAEFCEWTTGRRMGKIADHIVRRQDSLGVVGVEIKQAGRV